MFVSFAFYSATNIVFADVKDGKNDWFCWKELGGLTESLGPDIPRPSLCLFLDLVFVRNN